MTRALIDMLRYRRPARSATEQDFIARFIAPLGAVPDDYGNLWLDVGPADPSILWICHTDTVHRSPGLQRIHVRRGIATAVRGADCLGADCTAGVWIMAGMIRAGVSGRYVFHRDEEIGGLGSAWVARHTPERLAGIQAAIAFDRRGTGDVVTHQWGERTASDVFAWSVSDVLQLNYAPAHGIFTDTANYFELVPECTNISVGYDGEHGPGERLDLRHIETLLTAVIAGDWTALCIARTLPIDDDARDDMELDDRFDPYGHPAESTEWDAWLADFWPTIDDSCRGIT